MFEEVLIEVTLIGLVVTETFAVEEPEGVVVAPVLLELPLLCNCCC